MAWCIVCSLLVTLDCLGAQKHSGLIPVLVGAGLKGLKSCNVSRGNIGDWPVSPDLRGVSYHQFVLMKSGVEISDRVTGGWDRFRLAAGGRLEEDCLLQLPRPSKGKSLSSGCHHRMFALDQ